MDGVGWICHGDVCMQLNMNMDVPFRYIQWRRNLPVYSRLRELTRRNARSSQYPHVLCSQGPWPRCLHACPAHQARGGSEGQHCAVLCCGNCESIGKYILLGGEFEFVDQSRQLGPGQIYRSNSSDPQTPGDSPSDFCKQKTQIPRRRQMVRIGRVLHVNRAQL